MLFFTNENHTGTLHSEIDAFQYAPFTTISRYLGAKIRNNIEIIHDIAHFYTLFNKTCYFSTGLVELSSQSKILPHGKVKLVDEYLLEGIQTVLLVEDKHCLLVVDGVNRTETQRTVAVGYQNGVAGDAGRAFVAVRKSQAFSRCAVFPFRDGVVN